MKFKTTRQQILELLAAKEVMSVEDISQTLHLTAANTRHHLSNLSDEGLVQVAGLRKVDGRGRPMRLFQLSQPKLEHNLDLLSHLLLTSLRSCQEAPAWQQVLDGIASSLSDGYANLSPGSEIKPSLTQRLANCVERLNSMHYKARWEARTGGPRLILGHCPYWSIITDHPELCQVDHRMIQNMLGVPVIQTARLEPNPLGLRVCIFQVRTP